MQDGTRGAANAAKDRVTPPLYLLDALDGTFGQRGGADRQLIKRGDAGAVLVPQRSMSQDIEQTEDAEPLQPRTGVGTDALDRTDGNLLQCGNPKRIDRYEPSTMTASISTAASRGSDATPITARAG